MKRIRVGLIAAALCLFSMLIGSPSVSAAVNQPFTLQPGGKATITFIAFCTEFGKFFPQTIVEPNGSVASDDIRAALAYIDQKGYAADEGEALEANDAIWQLAGASNAPAGGDVTKDVLANGTTAPATPSGTSILDAAQAGQVTITLVDWAPIGAKVQILSATDNFYGQGTITVENTSQQELSLYMPIGTIFPGNEDRFQEVGGYPTDLKVENPNLPTTGAEDYLPIVPLVIGAAGFIMLGVLLRRGSRSRA